jgi:hypothetical protein
MITYQTLVLLVGLIAESVGVDILEDLVETELAETLSRVSDQGWEPTLDETTSTFEGNDRLQALDQTSELLGVGLKHRRNR